MHPKEIGFALLFAAAYCLLFGFLIGYTAVFVSPAWWYSLLGQNSMSAIAWLQIVHSLAVIGGAIPVAVAIVCFLPRKALRISYMAAGVACAVMLYDTASGYYLMFQFEWYALKPYHVASSVIDVLKVPVLLIAAVWLVSKVVPSNQRMERP